MTKEDLPIYLQFFFWDQDFQSLSWESHRDFIIRRILSEGDWRSIQWLIRKFGMAGIRDWTINNRAMGFDPRQIRFWEIALDLPAELVSEWLDERRADPWFGRTRR